MSLYSNIRTPCKQADEPEPIRYVFIEPGPNQTEIVATILEVIWNKTEKR